jgi:hypothetical protein
MAGTYMTVIAKIQSNFTSPFSLAVQKGSIAAFIVIILLDTMRKSLKNSTISH